MVQKDVKFNFNIQKKRIIFNITSTKSLLKLTKILNFSASQNRFQFELKLCVHKITFNCLTKIRKKLKIIL